MKARGDVATVGDTTGGGSGNPVMLDSAEPARDEILERAVVELRERITLP